MLKIMKKTKLHQRQFYGDIPWIVDIFCCKAMYTQGKKYLMERFLNSSITSYSKKLLHALQLYKVLRMHTPEYLLEFLQSHLPMGKYCSRPVKGEGSELNIPKMCTETGKKSFRFLGA